jgi:predicted  nucleic acid-binding Zn-ribbon protein
VEKHEHFEGLCAAASIGEASGAELAELQRHFSECADCRQVYSDFLQLGAVRCACNETEEQLSSGEAIGYVDSALFREQFFKKAEAEGIVFSKSPITSDTREGIASTIRVRNWRSHLAIGLAASILLACGIVGGYSYAVKEVQTSSHPGAAAVVPEPMPNRMAVPEPTLDSTIARLESQNKALFSEVESLKASLRNASTSLDQLQVNSEGFEKERTALATRVKQGETAITDLQTELDRARMEAATARAQLDKAQSDKEGSLVAAQVRIRELSDQLAEQSSSLDRERQMLGATRDIRDLMAARNLHIADVFDTDPKGKTRRAFGRVFFTEGKSLLFYAYDLNDSRVQDAGYNYRVWGKKEGPGQQARSLGIFFSDDKAQKRWVFKYSDPKVLSEIDSVFVTLEPPTNNPTRPGGDKLLYAYLRNQANHP